MIRKFSIATTLSWTATPLVFFITLLSYSSSHADGIRCGNKLALPGDTRIEVQAKCGAPSDIVHSTLARRSVVASYGQVRFAEEEMIVVPVEVWTYNWGPHRFMARLRFTNGVLEKLETLGYGFGAE